MGQTIAEKVLSRATGRKVAPGDVVYPIPDLMVMHEAPWIEMMDEIRRVGVKRVKTPEKAVVVFDHDVPVTTMKSAERNKRTRALLEELGITRIYHIGDHGIEHQLMVQAGEVLPGMLIVTMDPHSLNFGALGAVPIAVVYEFPTVMATGTVWVRVPTTIQAHLSGQMQPGVMARDVAMWVSAGIGYERADYRALEFTGPTLGAMSVDERMVLCNVATEVGAKTALVEPDDVTLAYLRSVTDRPFEVVRNDPDAEFEAVYRFDISGLSPMVGAPPSPDNVVPVGQVVGKKIDQAFIGSCASGTIEELRAAASLLRGRHVKPGVRLIISPATQHTFKKAAEEGLLRAFADAGALVSHPCCGYCYGVLSPLAEGEVCVSTSPRNDPGRMGGFTAEIYLASPLTAAASAVAGEIADPREFLAESEG